MNLYKITTPRANFFFETENMIIVSVYNQQLKEWVGLNIMDKDKSIIRYCELKGYSIEKCINSPQT